MSEYLDPARVERYLNQVQGQILNREHGERMVLDLLPPNHHRVLDLGTGDGRLIALIRHEYPRTSCVGLDISPVMVDRARERFHGVAGVEFHIHDLADPIIGFGAFDAVVSCFAIHHVDDDRKRSLYAEVFHLLRPGGVFANLEHVASPRARLHKAFYDAIGIPLEKEDPSNQCAPAAQQVAWLRDIGFEDADCYWKWREIAVLAGVKPEV